MRPKHAYIRLTRREGIGERSGVDGVDVIGLGKGVVAYFPIALEIGPIAAVSYTHLTLPTKA